MNFIGKLLGKFFRYVMLFAMILLGLNSVEAFSQGQGSFPELLVTLGMLTWSINSWCPWWSAF